MWTWWWSLMIGPWPVDEIWIFFLDMKITCKNSFFDLLLTPYMAKFWKSGPIPNFEFCIHVYKKIFPPNHSFGGTRKKSIPMLFSYLTKKFMSSQPVKTWSLNLVTMLRRNVYNFECSLVEPGTLGSVQFNFNFFLFFKCISMGNFLIE